MATTFMDTGEVRKISAGFGDASQVLKAVSMALEAAMMVLKVTAFVGLVGGVAIERYIASKKPIVDELAAKCEELAQDLEQAAALHEQAEIAGDSI